MVALLNSFNQIFSFAIISLVCMHLKVCLHLINFISAFPSSSRVLRSKHSPFGELFNHIFSFATISEYANILNLFTLFTSISCLTNVDRFYGR